MDPEEYYGWMKDVRPWWIFSGNRLKRKLAWLVLMWLFWTPFAFVGILLTLTIVGAVAGIPLAIGAYVFMAGIAQVGIKTRKELDDKDKPKEPPKNPGDPYENWPFNPMAG